MYKFWGRNPYLYKIACLVTFMGRENKLRSLAVKKLELQPGDRVLDLCCGTGLNFAHIMKAVGSSGKITAVDLSSDMLKAAADLGRQKKWENINFINQDATELNFEKNKFDGVISTLGISTIPEHKRALENAMRLLKPGKKAVVMDAESFSGAWRILNPLIKMIYKKTAEWDYKKNVINAFYQVFPGSAISQYNKKTIYILEGIKE